jgi:hypothetical protein
MPLCAEQAWLGEGLGVLERGRMHALTEIKGWSVATSSDGKLLGGSWLGWYVVGLNGVVCRE